MKNFIFFNMRFHVAKRQLLAKKIGVNLKPDKWAVLREVTGLGFINLN